LQKGFFPVDPATDAPAVAGVPRLLLRLEGLAAFFIAIAVYGRLDASWWLFALLFLVPDLSFLAYLAGSRAGAFTYNAVHTTAGPALVMIAGFWLSSQLAVAIGLIWFAHCSIDRALGYGLKYETGFGFTHLGRMGWLS
jgi:Domain of unknown function (DUF4260)